MKAVTDIGQSLMDDFGARREEVVPMIDQFEKLAFSLGLPPGGNIAIEPWLRRNGIDPDNVWKIALRRARQEGKASVN